MTQIAQIEDGVGGQILAGAFEASGISGVALACGAEAMGVRLAYPHMTLGVFDGKDVVEVSRLISAGKDSTITRT